MPFIHCNSSTKQRRLVFWNKSPQVFRLTDFSIKSSKGWCLVSGAWYLKPHLLKSWETANSQTAHWSCIHAHDSQLIPSRGRWGQNHRSRLTTCDSTDGISHRIHVWYIHLHLVDFYGKCRWIYHTWILWVWMKHSRETYCAIFSKLGNDKKIHIQTTKPSDHQSRNWDIRWDSPGRNCSYVFPSFFLEVMFLELSLRKPSASCALVEKGFPLHLGAVFWFMIRWPVGEVQKKHEKSQDVFNFANGESSFAA